MTAIILDTETTGIDAPEVIELAHTGALAWHPNDFAWRVPTVRRFKPSKPISPAAMAAHHIIPEDLEGCEAWPGAFPLPVGTEFLIGHNVDYDWQAIGAPPEVKRICTLALSRRLFPELDSHSLSAMVYHLYPPTLAREMVRSAHSAAADVALTFEIMSHMIAMLSVDDWDALYLKSEEARVPTHFTFGKYGPNGAANQGCKQGVEIAIVKRRDPNYIDWCLRSCDIVTGDVYWQRALS